jgi:hypothetical protein
MNRFRCGSGSERIRIHFGLLDPHPDPHWEYGSGSGSKRAKVTHKSEENLSFGVLLRDEDFSCSLEVLYEGLGISKLQFFIKNI